MNDASETKVPEGMTTPPDDIEKMLKLDRTDEEVGDEVPITVTFGGRPDGMTEEEYGKLSPEHLKEFWRQYPIVPAKRTNARQFRAAIIPIRPTITRLINVALAAASKPGDRDMQLAEALDILFVALEGDLDRAMDMIYIYCPKLAADKEWIEDNGDDEQFANALLAVVKVSYGPFVRAVGLSSRTLDLVFRGGSNNGDEQPTPQTETTDKPEDGSVPSETGTSSPTK